MTANESKSKPASAEVQNRVPYDRRTVEWHNVGLQRSYLADIYYYLLAASWRKLLGWGFAGYVFINFAFSLLYFVGLDGITGARPGSFSDAFFFSVQTFSTIGFGAMSPNSPYTHLLVTIESFAGLVAVALATGLIFAKFSRPTAALRFSEKAVIHERDGVPYLHLRIVNERQNEILNAHLTASVLIEETTSEGHTMRRIYRLPLVRDEIPLFAMAWTIMHPLDEDSPLWGLTAENVAERLIILIITIDGTDATFLQTVQTRQFYRPQDIEFNRQFVDMVIHRPDGTMELHHQHLNRTEPFGGWQRDL